MDNREPLLSAKKEYLGSDFDIFLRQKGLLKKCWADAWNKE